MQATMVFEDGTVFSGENFAADGEVIGDVVFHTGVVGYQEILTDPAYRGKIVLMTYPLIGNYGVNEEGMESDQTHALALVVKEVSSIYSNWMATGSLSEFMEEQKVVGLKGIDTRAAAIHIRDHGEPRAILSTKEADPKKLREKLKQLKELKGKDLVAEVTISKASEWLPSHAKDKMCVLDLGSSRSLNDLLAEHFQIKLFPATAKAKDILAEAPQAVFLSSGPGDPHELSEVVAEVKKLIGKVPLSGAGLGHHVLALALGVKVKKMKLGHHGVNYPVRRTDNGRADITVQNHSFTLDADSLKTQGIEILEININDNTVEAIRSKKDRVVSTEYFPLNLAELKELVG